VKVDTLRTVEAPEGVELALRVASPWPRSIAWFLDALLRSVVYGVVGGVLAFLGKTGFGLTMICIFLIEWGWPVVFEVWSNGATPGKKLMGLKVVCDDGTPVGFSQSFLRSLLSAADMLPIGYAFGLTSCLLSPDFKRLGDRVAGTLVIHRDPRPKIPGLPKVESLTPPFALAREEQAALLEFATRAKDWTPARTVEIADHLSPLTEERGDAGARAVLGMALWLEGAR
jgi:uncharacterized RDD family membrane protein YckC